MDCLGSSEASTNRAPVKPDSPTIIIATDASLFVISPALSKRGYILSKLHTNTRGPHVRLQPFRRSTTETKDNSAASVGLYRGSDHQVLPLDDA
jgi:hypothetical protein